MSVQTIPPQSGIGFTLRQGEALEVNAPGGSQVSDLFCFSQNRPLDALSSGKSIDYNETLRFSKGHTLYSNEGYPFLKITEDACGWHDFLVTPCSLQMFQMISKTKNYHASCHENLRRAFDVFDKPIELITTTFNIFMNYEIDEDGKMILRPPRNKSGDRIRFLALEDLVVGLTACSDPDTNGGECKSIEFDIIPA